MKIIRSVVSNEKSIKFLLKMEDENTIETLYMNDTDKILTYHSTVCVSSQVGCNQGCKFCATGSQGFVRNLSPSEIVSQVEICVDNCRSNKLPQIDAVVFAGMGEPFLNYDNVKKAITEISDKYKIINFEIATVGIVPSIHKMINDFRNNMVNIRLNLSLHASEDSIRKSIMPVNSAYDIKSILAAGVSYAEAFNTKTRIRYMLFRGINDTDDDVNRLAQLLKDKPLKLIISSYNDNNIEGLIPTAKNEVMDFYDKLKNKIDCGIFYNFGSDINGGCGQLRQKEKA